MNTINVEVHDHSRVRKFDVWFSSYWLREEITAMIRIGSSPAPTGHFGGRDPPWSLRPSPTNLTIPEFKSYYSFFRILEQEMRWTSDNSVGIIFTPEAAVSACSHVTTKCRSKDKWEIARLISGPLVRKLTEESLSKYGIRICYIEPRHISWALDYAHYLLEKGRNLRYSRLLF